MSGRRLLWTSDVRWRNPNGPLDLVDRVKYMIGSGGGDIYRAKIERRIPVHPAVVRKPDVRWGKVSVVIAAKTEEALTKDDVIAKCR